MAMADRVQVADVRQAWNLIEAGLWIVKRESAADWRPEDIYHMLRSGEAHLLLFDEGKTGFCILQQSRCPYSLCKVVNVVATFLEGEVNALDTFYPVVDQFAKDVGASYIEMYSRRKGWKRKGFEPHDIRYRRRL